MTNNRAFTLIELLAVVLIIGILAAVALPQYQKAVEKARAAQIQVFLNAAQKAIDAYVLENGIPEDEEFYFRYSGTERDQRDKLSIYIPISEKLKENFYMMVSCWNNEEDGTACWIDLTASNEANPDVRLTFENNTWSFSCSAVNEAICDYLQR